MSRRVLLSLILVLLFAGSAALLSGAIARSTLEPVDPKSEANWPGWRGPGGQGISTETNLPTEWDATKNVRWKTEIPGRGHSSPIVWGERIVLTTSFEGEVLAEAKPPKHLLGNEVFVHPDSTGGNRRQTLKVLCFDRANGKLLWERTPYEGRVFDDRHRKATYADSTPITDGQLIYVWFGSEGLYAYDFSGKLAWKKSFGGIATQGMGTGTSPVLYEHRLILQCDEDNGEKSFIVALDKVTGKELWRAPRRVEVNWSTPVIARGPAGDELVASGSQYVASYDPRTGRELWRCKGTQSWTVATPLVGNGIVVASAAHPVKRAVAIRLGSNGDVTNTPSIVWERDRGTGYTPSSILYRDLVYLMTDKGLLTCIDAKTGEVKYEGARVPKPATFTASPVAFGDQILISSEDGDTFVLKAGSQHEVLRVNSLDEPIYASPAISRGSIYIRGARHLYRIATDAKS